MGNGGSKEHGVARALNPVGIRIGLYIEVCSRCSYETVKLQIKNLLIKELNHCGYDVSYTIIPKKSNGDFFIYKVLGKEKKLVFTNDPQKNEGENAIFDSFLTENNIQSVIEKIILNK